MSRQATRIYTATTQAALRKVTDLNRGDVDALVPIIAADAAVESLLTALAGFSPYDCREKVLELLDIVRGDTFVRMTQAELRGTDPANRDGRAIGDTRELGA